MLNVQASFVPNVSEKQLNFINSIRSFAYGHGPHNMPLMDCGFSTHEAQMINHRPRHRHMSHSIPLICQHGHCTCSMQRAVATREEKVLKKSSKDAADIWAVISGISGTVYSVEEFDL